MIITSQEIERRKKISETMKAYRKKIPVWNAGKICPQISKSLKGKKAWNKGTHGKMGFMQNHPNWKGGRSINVWGYIRINVNSKYMLEHRYVMEQFLKRKLKPSEHIHHINGIKTDNQIKNLMLISNPVHNKIHFPHGWNPNRKK